MSGTSKLLAYPGFTSKSQLPQLAGRLCYLIEDYGTTGFSVLIDRSKETDELAVVCGDWSGMPLPLEHELVQTFLKTKMSTLTSLMQVTRLYQAQYYFAGSDFTLVDVQLSLNKFAGPGMLRDVFGNLGSHFGLQKARKVTPITEDVLAGLSSGSGEYAGPLIIKPSQPTIVEIDGRYKPIYVKLGV